MVAAEQNPSSSCLSKPPALSLSPTRRDCSQDDKVDVDRDGNDNLDYFLIKAKTRAKLMNDHV